MTKEVGIIPACAGNTLRRLRLVASGRDHPRVCGEHFGARVDRRERRGSSPRVRGTPVVQRFAEIGHGIIPACAGNTSSSRAVASRTWDHPRVCGEHHVPVQEYVPAAGSSPRVRGTRAGLRHRMSDPGIIPACAGNTKYCPRRKYADWDHPRVCGEHPCELILPAARPGSSPRVRGTRGRVGFFERAGGIIPACAGNTFAPSALTWCPWDHPRVCGEHFDHKGETLPAQGSSPRVRGTHPLGPVPHVWPGIIPACAGNTTTRSPPSRAPRDHPRVCGEHHPRATIAEVDPGSSPRVRGTRLPPSVGRLRLGIIPACAGNTMTCNELPPGWRDHPRVCGEHCIGDDIACDTDAGSSPRVRGTLR